MSQGAAYPSPAAKSDKSQVSAELDTMDAAISILHDAIKELMDRLTFVLRVEPPAVDADGAPEEALAPLPSLIREDRKNVGMATDAIRSIIRRLAI